MSTRGAVTSGLWRRCLPARWLAIGCGRPVGRRLASLCGPILLAAAGASAQLETATQPAPPAEWIRPEEVSTRADELLRRLESIRPDPTTQETLARMEAGLAKLGPELDARLAEADASLAAPGALTELEDLRRALSATAEPLHGWEEELGVEARRLAQVVEELAQAERLWSETRLRPETVEAGETVERRVQTSLEWLGGAAAELRTWRARVLDVSDRLIDRGATVEATREKLRETALAQRTGLLVPDSAPLWRRGIGTELERELPHVAEAVRAYAVSTREYLTRDARPFVLQALLAVFLGFALRRLATRARERVAREEELSRAARVLERPYAMALLLALMASPWLHALAPQRVMQLIATIALFPAARIVLYVSGRANLGAIGGLFVLLLFDRIELALAPLPTLSRTIFLLSLAVASGLALAFARRAREAGGSRLLPRAAKLALVGLALSLVAELGGWNALATLVGRGVLTSALAGLYLYAAVVALDAMLAYALTSPTLGRSRLVGVDPGLAQRRGERILRWLGVGVWVYLVLTALGLRGAGAEALRVLLGAGVSVGALSLSIGGVLGFVLTLLTAMALARIVTRVLEEDVYPRARLSRGIPYALSTLTRYGIYSLGFLLALAAAGFEIGQLSILIGGFGVGIGLGLQDLVKNFAAGLTLLFERRVHVGDALQIPSQEIFGRVLAIEMRATVIRSWDGAEVVVPNADLVSTAFTNWTLSDRLRRIEVPVGVAYGSEPDRVVYLLIEVARANPELLPEPAPQALFKGFGESSLDFVLRAWTDTEYERTLPLTSELALAVHRGLQEAGVTIPFPQRDVHLASLSPSVREALHGRRDDGAE